MQEGDGRRILALKNRIFENFTSSDWQEIGLLTDSSNLIDRHPRLLRSLSFGDEDYGGNVIYILKQISMNNPQGLQEIEDYVDEKYPDSGATIYISSKPSQRKITFAPNVFHVPELNLEDDLVSLMMPFNREFSEVHLSIKEACTAAGYRCLRADDIWEESTIIQDIFNLIYRSKIVIADFTNKNANVMYETGIAHTLGKTVIPITQALSDIPFDMQHHRTLKYLPNTEGLIELKNVLVPKLRMLRS